MNPVLSWQEHGECHSAAWRSESRHQPPQRIEAVAQISAEQALSLMHQNTALLWRGDYHQGKQLLAAIKKRVRRHSKPAADFHRHRLQQSQHSRLFNLLLLEVQPGFMLANGRAPDVQAALDADADTRPEIILIGTGAQTQMIHPRLYATLGQHGIGVEVMNTGAACRTFNVLSGEGRRVWAWLWPL